MELASQSYIVTSGLKPTKPENGFGYIEANREDMKSFRVKPNQETAESFINTYPIMVTPKIFMIT